MKLLLDTANIEDIRYINTYFPIMGVTTNPTILSREGGDAAARLREIRAIIGADKELHVQVTEHEYEKIMEEANILYKELGPNTFVKVPITDVGLRVTRELKKMGYHVTVTAVLSAGQAMLAANAGADYVAPYVSRLENICENGVEAVAEIQRVFDAAGTSTKILAASFKTAREVLDVALTGAATATVSTFVMQKLLVHTTTDTSIHGFADDWKNAFGDRTLGSMFTEGAKK